MRQRLSHHVNGQRLWDRLMLLANYGARADGGVDRPALSDVEAEARAQLIGWGRELGLQPFTDPIANLFLRLEGSRPDLSPVLIGSHIDSQPTGGKFDGAFGVLAALEVIEAIRDSGEQPLRSIEVVAWTNEEGSRFAPGMSGSEAFAGVKPLETLLAVTDAAGCSVREAAARVLARDVDVPQRPFGWRPAAFVEAHIEQAPLLERAGVPIGVVTGIQGTRRYRVRVRGEAAHAGTTLRAERKDALMAAVRMIRAIDAVASDPADVMLTVGMMRLTPNAPSVVPEEAYFSIDLRHVDDAVVDRIDAEIRRIVADESEPCSATLDQIAHAPSLDFAPQIRAAITTAAEAAELPAMPIYSAAGHDARQLHYICPTGMIFIPCRGGISHNPAEWAEPDHVTAGARVLADVTMALASQGDEGAGRA